MSGPQVSVVTPKPGRETNPTPKELDAQTIVLTKDGKEGMITIKKEDGKTIVSFSGVLFDFDKDNPKDPELVALIARITKDNGTPIVEVQGHTDAKGSRSYNNNLSKRRAENVIRELDKSGAAFGDKAAGRAYGEDAPVALNEIDGKDNAQGRALNRRVVVVIEDKDGKTFDKLKSEMARQGWTQAAPEQTRSKLTLAGVKLPPAPGRAGVAAENSAAANPLKAALESGQIEEAAIAKLPPERQRLAYALAGDQEKLNKALTGLAAEEQKAYRDIAEQAKQYREQKCTFEGYLARIDRLHANIEVSNPDKTFKAQERVDSNRAYKQAQTLWLAEKEWIDKQYQALKPLAETYGQNLNTLNSADAADPKKASAALAQNKAVMEKVLQGPEFEELRKREAPHAGEACTVEGPARPPAVSEGTMILSSLAGVSNGDAEIAAAPENRKLSVAALYGRADKIGPAEGESALKAQAESMAGLQRKFREFAVLTAIDWEGSAPQALGEAANALQKQISRLEGADTAQHADALLKISETLERLEKNEQYRTFRSRSLVNLAKSGQLPDELTAIETAEIRELNAVGKQIADGNSVLSAIENGLDKAPDGPQKEAAKADRQTIAAARSEFNKLFDEYRKFAEDKLPEALAAGKKVVKFLEDDALDTILRRYAALAAPVRS